LGLFLADAGSFVVAVLLNLVQNLLFGNNKASARRWNKSAWPTGINYQKRFVQFVKLMVRKSGN